LSISEWRDSTKDYQFKQYDPLNQPTAIPRESVFGDYVTPNPALPSPPTNGTGHSGDWLCYTDKEVPMTDNLYEVAALLDPTEEEQEKGERSRLVVDPVVFVANSEAEARIMAARDIPENLESELGRVRILVRPFV